MKGEISAAKIYSDSLCLDSLEAFEQALIGIKYRANEIEQVLIRIQNQFPEAKTSLMELQNWFVKEIK